MTAAWTRRRYRAPRANGGLTAEPPLSAARTVAEANRRLLDAADLSLGGRSVADLRQLARSECIDSARRFASDYALVDPSKSSCQKTGLWFVTGHQPQLYHPGVWVKNFATAMLARQTAGVGLNLIVDNDIVTTFAVRAPAGDRETPVPLVLPYDVARPTQIWETAVIQDRTLFDSFAERVDSAMRPWGVDPVVRDFWPLVQRAAQHSDQLAEVLSSGRAALERKWGAGNCELPISRMCQTESFATFACDLLAELPRFHALHNAILGEYREINHVRSRTHPVPDLRATAAGLEAPFWIWQAGDTKRGRLFVQRRGELLVLSQESTSLAELPVGGDPNNLLEAFSRLQSRGLQLRPRALTTTLFSRLLLADVFMHGIGGAKYDETTDQLLQRFYNIRPPDFLTLSSTLHLPLEPHSATQADQHKLERALRDVRYHPLEVCPRLRRQPDAMGWIAEREQWLAEQQAVSAARRAQQNGVVSAGVRRFTRLHELTAQLSELAAPRREQLRQDLAVTQRHLHANRLLQDREYAFCLFPESQLRDAMQSWFAPSTS